MFGRQCRESESPSEIGRSGQLILFFNLVTSELVAWAALIAGSRSSYGSIIVDARAAKIHAVGPL